MKSFDEISVNESETDINVYCHLKTKRESV